MRKILAILTIALILLGGSSAWAGERIMLDCIDMPGCCTFTCVMIDVKCCGGGYGNGPLLAEFLDQKGDVLGTATFTGNWCCGETYGQTDKPVNSNDVCSIRLVKQDDCTTITWASLRVLCGDECHSKWHKVFKGKLWCWEPIPVAPPAATPPPPPPPPPPAEPPAVEPEPEKVPEFAPPPDSEPEPEVIIVPGRG